MLALERRNSILEKLQDEKKVVVSELSQFYSVSEETIRRDLEKLHQDGLCIKSYGGAVINENTNSDMPYNVRNKRNIEGKQKIAEIIAGLIEDGDHIMLDGSSTAVSIAKVIKNKERLTVVTNSVEILMVLSDVSGWNVISTGGVLKEGYLALVGQKTIDSISKYNVKKTIISCKAFNLEQGFSDSNDDFAGAKEMMIQCAQQKILAVDSSKFGKQGFITVGELSDIDIIVTDKKPEEKYLKGILNKGIQCLYPEA